MTAKELIEQLQEAPEHAEVWLAAEDDDGNEFWGTVKRFNLDEPSQSVELYAD